MHRRTFIGTITALAGAVLAKIKAPAATVKLQHRGVTQFAISQPITAVRKTLDGFVVFSKFSKSKAYIYKDGWHEWKHPISEQYGSLLTLNEYGTLVDTCPRCGAQAHPGYDLICCCSPDAIQQITDDHTLPLHIRLKPPADKP